MTTLSLADYYRDEACAEVLAENRPRLMGIAQALASVTSRTDLSRPRRLSEIPASNMEAPDGKDRSA